MKAGGRFILSCTVASARFAIDQRTATLILDKCHRSTMIRTMLERVLIHRGTEQVSCL